MNIDSEREADGAWYQSAQVRVFITLLDQAVVSGARFLTAVLVGRYAGVDELGIYTLAYSVAMVFLNLQNALICGPYMVFSAREGETDRGRLAGSVLLHLCGFIVVVVLLCLAAALLLQIPVLQSVRVDGDSAAAPDTAAIILAISLPFLLLRNFARSFAFAHLRQLTAAVMDIAADSVLMICLLLLILDQSLSGASAFYAMAAGSALAFICSTPTEIGDIVKEYDCGRR